MEWTDEWWCNAREVPCFPEPANKDWVLATCDYGGEFVAAVQKGDVMACQFHPEKSGDKGIGIFKSFLEGTTAEKPGEYITTPRPAGPSAGPQSNYLHSVGYGVFWDNRRQTA